MNSKKIVYCVVLANMFCVPSTFSETFSKLQLALPGEINILGQEPIFDFDGDGCYPAAGISQQGFKNSGLATTGGIAEHCRATNFLSSSNTLHRYACTDFGGQTYCGHFYALYFEKDQVISFYDPIGHRHDWEHVAIWTKNGVITHASYSSHGQLKTKSVSEVETQGDHVKFVYHKDGGGTHAMRFAHGNETAENSYGYWVTPDIASWYQLKGSSLNNASMRNLLNHFNYGKAVIPIKDNNFLTNLNRDKPSTYPNFNQYDIENSH
ncbi:NPP1 family protein [Vibrio navarrensis]